MESVTPAPVERVGVGPRGEERRHRLELALRARLEQRRETIGREHLERCAALEEELERGHVAGGGGAVEGGAATVVGRTHGQLTERRLKRPGAFGGGHEPRGRS